MAFGHVARHRGQDGIVGRSEAHRPEGAVALSETRWLVA